MNDDKFWRDTERAEESFTGDADVTRFRRRMARLGHDEAVIRDRIEAIHPQIKEQNP